MGILARRKNKLFSHWFFPEQQGSWHASAGEDGFGSRQSKDGFGRKVWKTAENHRFLGLHFSELTKLGGLGSLILEPETFLWSRT